MREIGLFFPARAALVVAACCGGTRWQHSVKRNRISVQLQKLALLMNGALKATGSAVYFINKISVSNFSLIERQATLVARISRAQQKETNGLKRRQRKAHTRFVIMRAFRAFGNLARSLPASALVKKGRVSPPLRVPPSIAPPPYVAGGPPPPPVQTLEIKDAKCAFSH